MNKEEFGKNVSDAIGAHSMWKTKLKTAVRTGVLPKPASDIACDDQCSFGKWIYGMTGDTSLSGSSHYTAVKAKHAEFHKAVAAVARAVEVGDKGKAEALLEGPDFTNTTHDLKQLLLKWRQAC